MHAQTAAPELMLLMLVIGVLMMVLGDADTAPARVINYWQSQKRGGRGVGEQGRGCTHDAHTHACMPAFSA